MADNVAITAGTGTTIAADDIGGVLYQRVKVALGADGTGVDASAGAGAVGTGVQRVTLASDDPAVATLGATSGAAVITDATGTIQQYLRGLVKRWVDALGAGTAAAALRTTLASDDPAVTLLTPWGFDVAVTAATSTFATPYTAGDIMGALLTFSNCARVADEAIVINGITIASKVAVAPSLTLVLFSADPTNTTKTDNAAYSLNASDVFNVIKSVPVSTIYDHGTPNTWSTDNLGIVCKPASGTRTIFGLLIDGTGVTLSSATDIQVRLRGLGA